MFSPVAARSAKERCRGNRRIRVILRNGVRIAAFTNVADESLTMLTIGLAQARANGWSVILAAPFPLGHLE